LSDRQTDRQSRQTEQTDRTDRQTDRADRQSRHTYNVTDRQTDLQTDKQTNRQTENTDRTDRQIEQTEQTEQKEQTEQTDVDRDNRQTDRGKDRAERQNSRAEMFIRKILSLHRRSLLVFPKAVPMVVERVDFLSYIMRSLDIVRREFGIVFGVKSCNGRLA
jgi:hypothetical protein